MVFGSLVFLVFSSFLTCLPNYEIIRLFLWRRVHGLPMGGTTGVSLEQGLGLMDVPRGCPGRRPGDERSYAPDYYFIIYKINPSARDPRTRLSPGS